jgi:hypothetical protein
MTSLNLAAARWAAELHLMGIAKAIDPSASRQAIREKVIISVSDSRFNAGEEKQTAQFIQAARSGDQVVREALHLGIAWLLQNDEKIPDQIKQYISDVLLAPTTTKKPGPSPHDRVLRDQLISRAVHAAMGHGLSRTRSPASQAPSACSLVREVLEAKGVHMSEKNIEEISS